MLVEGDFLQQFLGEGEQLLFGEQQVGGGDGTGDLGEVVELHFECERVTLELGALQAVEEFEQDVVELDGDGGG